jgi:8-amino-7-oxononanoate synthase
MSLTERWRQALEELEMRGRRRQLALPRGIDFTSNDYLGFGKAPPPSGNAPLRGDGRAGNDALARSGRASRLLCGHHPLWDDVEQRLAQWHGAEAALMFTSGYMANEGLLATLIEPQDWVAADALNHASLIDGIRLSRAEKYVYRHGDLEDLETALRTAAHRRSPARQLFVVTESLFGMDGDVAALPELAALARRYDAQLVVDEAHATGCLGPRGSGLVDAAGLRGCVCATIHTGGKALGVLGAYVATSALLRELLVNRARHFIFTTALPPVLAAWWLAALAQVQSADIERQALHTNAALFRAELAEGGITPPGQAYILPLIVGEDAAALAVARRLQKAGWDVRAIRPPTVPVGTARLRISVHADHEPATLGALAGAIRAAEVEAWTSGRGFRSPATGRSLA